MRNKMNDAIYLEDFLRDYEFPPAFYDVAHAVNDRWVEEYALVEYNKHNRKILSSTINNGLLHLLESKGVSVLFKDRDDGIKSIYHFNTHSLTIQDRDGCVVGHEDIDLDADSCIHLMNCILDFLNY